MSRGDDGVALTFSSCGGQYDSLPSSVQVIRMLERRGEGEGGGRDEYRLADEFRWLPHSLCFPSPTSVPSPPVQSHSAVNTLSLQLKH